MSAIRLGLLCLFLGGVMVQADAPAEMPFSALCQTPRGICTASSAPVGTACQCGRDRGKMIVPPPTLSNACGTPKGVCRVEHGPIGSACGCGRDQGQRIQFK
jgi:hypothetical protein